MSSTFVAVDAAQYEQMMGRWSRDLAALFIEFAGVRDGESVLDVGCGTGSLTYALARCGARASAHRHRSGAGVSRCGARQAECRLGALRASGRDRLALRGCQLRSRAFAPRPAFRSRIAARPRRDATRREAGRSLSARPSGTSAGGYLAQRLFWDTAACLLPSGEEGRKRAFCAPPDAQGRDAAPPSSRAASPTCSTPASPSA